jgi:hypothetical protein
MQVTEINSMTFNIKKMSPVYMGAGLVALTLTSRC